MKLIKFLPLLAFLALFGCKDEVNEPTFTSESGFTLTLPYDIEVGDTLTFTASDNWTIAAINNMAFTLSQSSGKAGVNKIIVKAQNYNCTNKDAKYNFTISSTNEAGTAERTVNITHRPVFEIDTLYYEAKPEGDTIQVKFRTEVQDSQQFYIFYDTRTDFATMWNNGSQIAGTKVEAQAQVVTRTSDSSNEWIATIKINPNKSEHSRNGKFIFTVGKEIIMYSETMEVSQAGTNAYTSQDMTTDDGKITQLLSHTIGNGVPVVILGDGFLDTDISSGKFRQASEKALDALFSTHPMSHLKQYFDVYEVTAVSLNNYFTNSSSTAFSSKFSSGTSTEITGNDDKAITYALKAVSTDKIQNALIIVLINDSRYAGTCAMYRGKTPTDIPEGYSIAYVPLTEYTSPGTEFSGVLSHEAVGHGFAKLQDEYCYTGQGTIPNYEIDDIKKWQDYGLGLNVTFSSDVTASNWADFAVDDNYASEALGCYQGACGYEKGVYRPTESSIMDDNQGDFNAIARKIIYQRCMKIALGSSWKYSQADFTAFDLKYTGNAATRRNATARRTASTVQPLFAPRIKVMRSK